VSWVLNMTVDADYERLDPSRHLLSVAGQLQLDDRGIAMMTAVNINNRRTAEAGGVTACATVGVSRPVWAATFEDVDHRHSGPGTINLVVQVPARLSDAALVNVVSTATEAKVQALLDHGIAGTGTASDAVAVLCATRGTAELFGGPRSTWGCRVAQAVYSATAAGLWLSEDDAGFVGGEPARR